jgi:hypothetical protein
MSEILPDSHRAQVSKYADNAESFMQFESARFSDIEIGSGYKHKDERRETLVNHLKSLHHGHDARAVIELLHDIRTHQDHPKLQSTFESNPDSIAHHAKHHNQDVIELLVEDYLNHMEIPDDIRDEEALERHLVDIIFNSLKEFHEVVEEIRDDVEGVAAHFESESDIEDVADLIEQIRDNLDHHHVQDAINKLHKHHTSHAVFQEEHLDLSVHNALAKAWVKKAHRDGNDVQDYRAATDFVREELHAHLKDHFRDHIDDTGTLRLESEIVRKNAEADAEEKEHQKQHAYEIAWALSLENPDIKHTVAIIQKGRAYLSGPDSREKEDIQEMREAIGFVSQYGEVLEQLIYEQKGDEVLNDLVDLWIEQNPQGPDGPAENWQEELEAFITGAAIQVQMYLPISVQPTYETGRPPMKPANDTHSESFPDDRDLMKQLDEASEGSLEANVLQLYTAAIRNYSTHEPLIQAAKSDERLEFFIRAFQQKSSIKQGMIALFMTHQERAGKQSKSFKGFLEYLNRVFKESVNPELYDYLMHWKPMEAMPTPPQSFRELKSKKDNQSEVFSTKDSDRITKLPGLPDDLMAMGIHAETVRTADLQPATEPESLHLPPTVPPPKKGSIDTAEVNASETVRPGQRHTEKEFSASEAPSSILSGKNRKNPDVIVNRSNMHSLSVREGEQNVPGETIRPKSLGFQEAPKKEAFIYEASNYVVPAGSRIDVTYAMKQSLIEVEDGAALDLYMVDDGATIKLKGPSASLNLQFAAKSCQSIKIIDHEGQAVQKAPNVVLGKNVVSKVVG